MTGAGNPLSGVYSQKGVRGFIWGFQLLKLLRGFKLGSFEAPKAFEAPRLKPLRSFIFFCNFLLTYFG
jgi:hypothetical protein